MLASERRTHPLIGRSGRFRKRIVTWIERTYHRRRRQRALGKLTPIELETIYAAADAA